MSKTTSYSHPFLHYQIQHWISDKGEFLGARGRAFEPLPLTDKTMVPLAYGKLVSLVYNIYLYDEHAVFIESFAHEFDPVAEINRHILRAPLVCREVSDVFPGVNHLPTIVRAMKVWQFAD